MANKVKFVSRKEWLDVLRFVDQECKPALERIRAASVKKPNLRHNRTRATFAWTMQNRAIGRLKPIDLVSNDVPYQPVGHALPLMYDQPIFSMKFATEWWVIKRWKNGHSSKIMGGFTRACPEDKFCKRPNCAKCWALQQKKLPAGQEWLVKEVIMQDAEVKIVDPNGVSPSGTQSHRKGLDPETRAKFRLSSTIHAYKPGAASWGDGS